MRMAMIVAAALAVSACGGKSADGNSSSVAAADTPVKHQPGSWSNKIEITKLDAGPGVDATKIKAGLQQIFDAASGVSVCITPELAAYDNPAANVERLAAQGKKCDFDRKIANGERLDYAGICSDANGTRMRIAITGTNGATAQDITVRSEPIGGPAKGSMEMRITSQRTGECKKGDITPPVPGETPGNAAG